MVDMESHYHPPSPLEDSVLESSLCADDDLMGSMDELQDISQSIDDDALSSFDVPEYQSSSNGSEGSTVIGKKKKKLHSHQQTQGLWVWSYLPVNVVASRD